MTDTFAPPTTPVQQWEYHYEHLQTNPLTTRTKGKLHTDEIPQRLNELGAQGWELVTSTAAILGGQGTLITFIFKRPKR